ncbi:hypothetical protein HDV05_004060 [Chytridiales sp. JEL 0842]|nr:hypothetical protein HDV05_004060 [Chytridiales sp. JEL 0842]
MFPLIDNPSSDSPPTPESIASEQQVFQKTVRSYRNYKSHTLQSLSKRLRDFNSIHPRFKELVPEFEKRLGMCELRVGRNQEFLGKLVMGQGFEEMEGVVGGGTSDGGDKKKEPILESDMDKVRTTLKQFVRDWGAEGAKEREATYTPIVDALESCFKDLSLEKRGNVTVLLPGAGLGRLAFDIAKKGFSTQGNEFSFHMLLASNFALNNLKRPQEFEIYPWIHTFSNTPTSLDQLSPVLIPDVAPGGIPRSADFSMVAGDFLEVYTDPSQLGVWDSVVTCYFIDTAKNIIEYLEVISGCLKIGGVWINNGPLLYHFEGMRSEISIDLNLEEVKSVARKMGFVFEVEKFLPSTYTANPNSMLTYTYNCAFWVARKVR